MNPTQMKNDVDTVVPVFNGDRKKTERAKNSKESLDNLSLTLNVKTIDISTIISPRPDYTTTPHLSPLQKILGCHSRVTKSLGLNP